MTKNTPGDMWVYIHEDINDINECKFGEKFVLPGKNTDREIQKRIRKSLGVRKDRYDEGKIKTITTINVSELARKVQRNYKGAQMDALLRECVGHRKGKTGEIHTLSGEEMAIRVNQILAKLEAPLPIAYLSQPQATELLSIKNLFNSGSNVILAELCARFGKTILAGALAKEMNTALTVVATYVQTSTTSFMKDLTSFQQWADYVHVDTKNEDYEKQIADAFQDGKKVIAYLSLCHGSKRDERVTFLSSCQVSTLLFIDEADFGAHKISQVTALDPLRNKKDIKILLMTGTNGDRASKLWSPDAAVSVVYPELLVAKNNTPEETPEPFILNGLKHFKIGTCRHKLYPGVSLYQADLTSVVEHSLAEDPELFCNEEGEQNTNILPSWSKFAANPIKAKGFYVNMLRAVFNASGSFDELNVDHQFGISAPRVRMMFLPGNTKNENMDHIINITSQTLGASWEIVPLYGKVTTNRKSEQKAREAVERAHKNNNNVLIISAGMAQRSFSIGEIEEIYLAYDSGDIGATTQKMSRALTPNSPDKVGRIVSLSFDPNRDDKFDLVMLEAAKNLSQKTGQCINESLNAVFKSIDLFKFSEDGAVCINQDQYLKGVLSVRRISRVIGASANVAMLSEQDLRSLASGNSSYFKQARVISAKKGKTFKDKKAHNQSNSNGISNKMIEKARQVITTIVENVDIMIFGTNSNNIIEAIKVIDSTEDYKKDIENEFGLSFDIIAYLFESGIINIQLVDLLAQKIR